MTPGHFAQVQVNEHLTLNFADEPEEWGGPGSSRLQGSEGAFGNASNLKLEGPIGRPRPSHSVRMTANNSRGLLLPSVRCRQMPTEMNRPRKATIATWAFERASRGFRLRSVC